MYVYVGIYIYIYTSINMYTDKSARCARPAARLEA